MFKKFSIFNDQSVRTAHAKDTSFSQSAGYHRASKLIQELVRYSFELTNYSPSAWLAPAENERLYSLMTPGRSPGSGAEFLERFECAYRIECALVFYPKEPPKDRDIFGVHLAFFSKGKREPSIGNRVFVIDAITGLVSFRD